ncbi:hypothetical protein PMIN05_002494 [Paraphaeosphaeria minitans]
MPSTAFWGRSVREVLAGDAAGGRNETNRNETKQIDSGIPSAPEITSQVAVPITKKPAAFIPLNRGAAHCASHECGLESGYTLPRYKTNHPSPRGLGTRYA